MDTKHVLEFLQIVKSGSFSLAADELFISQSVLSRHIQLFEEVIGGELFDRTTRKVNLSEFGAVFLPYAQKLASVEIECIKELSEHKRRHLNKLSIGSLPVMAYYNVMSNISEFQKLNTNMNVNIIEYNGNAIVKSLIDKEFELAFCDQTLVQEDKRIETIRYCEDHVITVLPKNHPLAKNKVVELKLLNNEKLLFMDKTTPIYSVCYDLCKEAGFTPNIYFSGVRIENLLELVSQGMGVALLMKKYTILSKIKNSIIKEIYPTCMRTIVLCRIKSNHHSKESLAFWDFIKMNQS